VRKYVKPVDDWLAAGPHKSQVTSSNEVHGPDSVRVLVAIKAKPNRYVGSSLDREYFINFLNVSSILFSV
jgi:hypothetical protein